MTLAEIIDHIGIEPYYREDAGVIFNADCLNIMKKMPDKCVDLVVTDPPYGMRIDRALHNASNTKYGKSLAIKKDYGSTDWDYKPNPDYFNRLIFISQNQIIFGGNYFTDTLPISRGWIIWDKKCDEKYSNDFADCELVWTSFDMPARIFRWLWHGMLQHNMSNKEKRVHPTQKPLPLMKWIIEKYSQPNQVICDSFFGSGSTLIAAKQLGRKYVGVETSEAYCKIAVQRLAQEILI